MASPQNPACENCQFRGPMNPGAVHVQCRRYPHFETRRNTDYCGEFKQGPPPIADSVQTAESTGD